MRVRAFASLSGCTLLLSLGTVSPARAQGGAGPPVAVSAPTPGQILRLDEAVAIALRLQPTITASQQTEVATQARIGEAWAAWRPKVDWVTSAGRSQVFSSSQGKTVQSSGGSTQLQASQLIYDFGKTGATIDQAKAGARVANAQLVQTRQLVVQNVKTAYYNLLQARRLVRVAEANLARSELNLRSAQGFFDVGTKPKSDVTKAEVEVANARVAIIQVRNQVALAQTTLINAIGLQSTTPLEVEDILGYEPVTLDFPALLQEAIASRPELRQAQAQIDSAQSAVTVARAGYLPTLNVTGSYGGLSSDPALNLFANGSESWAVTGNLTWNLFQGFLTTNQVKETRALLEVARANYASQELQVRLDIEQAYLNVLEVSERIGATDKEVQSAQENLRLAQGRYDAGVGTILDLTDAQLSLTNAEADQVRALTDFRVRMATLDRVLGRP
jgi:TolC family type I secretion outer membrane protein